MIDKLEIEKWAQSQTDEIVAYIHLNFKPQFSCSTRWDWSERRTCSRGGQYINGPGINIAMAKHVRPNTSLDNLYAYHEYASFDKDPEIGGFASDNWQLSFTAVLCHEIAHACHSNKERHGDNWKNTYSILRRKFVNPFIKQNLKKDNRPNYVDTDKHQYEQYCLSHGMRKEWFGCTFIEQDHKFTIAGWFPTARKWFVKVVREDNKIFKMQPDHVIQGFQKGMIK